jgi:GDP-D-mannose dehydratase
MAIDPGTTDVVTILGLAQHPAFPVSQVNRQKIHFGVDSEISGVRSYRMDAEELKTLLGVTDSSLAVNVVATGHTWSVRDFLSSAVYWSGLPGNDEDYVTIDPNLFRPAEVVS